MVPSTEVLNKLFRISDDSKKAWKTKKIPLGDFENITGELTTSVSAFDIHLRPITMMMLEMC